MSEKVVEKVHVSTGISALEITDLVEGHSVSIEGNECVITLDPEELGPGEKRQIAQSVVNWL